VSAGPRLFAEPEFTASTLFPGRDPKHPERAGRGWGRETKYVEGKLVSSESWGGYIAYERADKYGLERRVSPLCKSIIEHLMSEQQHPSKPGWVEAPLDQLIMMTGRKRRAIEMAIEEGVQKGKTAELPGIVERQNPERRYDKGGYRVHLTPEAPRLWKGNGSTGSRRARGTRAPNRRNRA
jgi:hypothetical protein